MSTLGCSLEPGTEVTEQPEPDVVEIAGSLWSPPAPEEPPRAGCSAPWPGAVGDPQEEIPQPIWAKPMGPKTPQLHSSYGLPIDRLLVVPE